jgi:hypothetical protein
MVACAPHTRMRAHTNAHNLAPRRPPPHCSPLHQVWARPLANGDIALLLFNNGVPGPVAVACNASCLSAASGGKWGGNTTLKVRDVWAQSDNGTVVGAFAAPAVPTNATVFVRLSLA